MLLSSVSGKREERRLLCRAKKTRAALFDFPQGASVVLLAIYGGAGIPGSNVPQQLLFAWRFQGGLVGGFSIYEIFLHGVVPPDSNEYSHDSLHDKHHRQSCLHIVVPQL